MSETTKIEWCDSTFSPWIGCTKVSPACDHCYAERSGPARTMSIAWGAKAQRHRTTPGNWALPLRWNAQADAFEAEHGRRRRVFCASLADVFDNEVPVEWRADLWRLIRETPRLDWLLLTKRIGNAMGMLYDAEEPLQNVWLGATVCNQAEADRDIPKLLATPAPVRFLSMEALLGPVDLRVHFAGHCPVHDFAGGFCIQRDHPGVQHLHWVIAGGESGPHARPMHPDWVRSLRDQCAAAGVPFLFKQWGEWAPPTRAEDLRFLGDLMRSGKAVHVYGDGREPDGCFRRGDDHLLRVGKRAAGRLLDGAEHNGYPPEPHQ